MLANHTNASSSGVDHCELDEGADSEGIGAGAGLSVGRFHPLVLEIVVGIRTTDNGSGQLVFIGIFVIARVHKAHARIRPCMASRYGYCPEDGQSA